MEKVCGTVIGVSTLGKYQPYLTRKHPLEKNSRTVEDQKTGCRSLHGNMYRNRYVFPREDPQFFPSTFLEPEHTMLVLQLNSSGPRNS